MRHWIFLYSGGRIWHRKFNQSWPIFLRFGDSFGDEFVDCDRFDGFTSIPIGAFLWVGEVFALAIVSRPL